MYDIVTVGEILTEILAENKDQDFSIPGGTLLGGFPSGAPAIAIDQSARMGAKTAIIAKVGTDKFGTMNLQRLKENGVDLDHVLITDKNVTGTAFVSYSSDGSRNFIFHFETAACGELCADDIDEKVISSAKYLHIMGCSITGSPSMADAIIKAVRIAKANKVKISFDPNIRPELLHGKIRNQFKEVLESCDILLSGKSELPLLFKKLPDDLHDLLLKNKNMILVIKDGARNTFVYSLQESFSVPSFPSIEVDATGAGDCFDGTFLAMLSKGESLKKAALYGNASGALAVAKRGPMEGNSNFETLEKFVMDNPDIKISNIARLI